MQAPRRGQAASLAAVTSLAPDVASSAVVSKRAAASGHPGTTSVSASGVPRNGDADDETNAAHGSSVGHCPTARRPFSVRPLTSMSDTPQSVGIGAPLM